MKFEQTGLWQRALQPRDDDDHQTERERLRNSYRQFWNNACHLSRQIAADLPGLTLHDDAHFTSLWDRADQIGGLSLDLTPLEVYVFGGAILLHDAANTVAAFEHRQKEVEESPEWKDVVTDILSRNANSQDDDNGGPTLSPEQKSTALLSTLRILHARQAEELAGFQARFDNKSSFLIEDEQIRNHLGRIMGLIAASHHWSIQEVEHKLGQHSHPAIGGFPRDWTVRPILLSCLLRCADATQIDQTRTPDFLYRLLNLRGLSETHWRAQNRLAVPFVEPGETRALVFRSTSPYLEQDADAWWVAYDAIQVAHSELQNCNALLSDLKLPTFTVDRVRYAESPSRLSILVEARGWRPVSAEVRINKVDKIVTMFGGTELYGNDFSVPLRELIQNAADAVRQRRALETDNPDYSGRINIVLDRGPNDDGYWIKVEDDGIGMSEAALVGPLLDFGSSYVSSALARIERPGLSAKRFKRVGKFGIGFFSVFMLSNRVSVTSRAFDRGLDATRTLSFRSGMLLRPLLLESKAGSTSTSISTRVAAHISKETLEKMLRVDLQGEQKSIQITLEQQIAYTCPMLDVDVYYQDEFGVRKKVHSAQWAQEDRLAWLRRISLADVRQMPNLDTTLERVAGALEFIDEKDPSAGMAAISFGADAAGVRTIGGLRAGSRGFNPFIQWYAGAIDFTPEGPQRSQGTIRCMSKMPDWARRQAEKFSSIELTSLERHQAAVTSAQFKAAPTKLAMIWLNRSLVGLQDCLDVLKAGKSLFIILGRERRTFKDEEGMVLISQLRPNTHSLYQNFFRDGEIDFSENVIEAFNVGMETRDYYAVPTDVTEPTYGFIFCLEQYILASGSESTSTIETNIEVGKYVGKSSDREGLFTGSSIIESGMRLKLVDRQKLTEVGSETPPSVTVSVQA